MCNSKMIKKVICVFISVIMLFGLVSCNGGGAKQLPDVYIDLEVTDFITAEEIDRPYSYEATHSYDSETHMDTVNITLRVEYDYGDEIYTGKCIYYYDKTSDLWDYSRRIWSEGEHQYIERYIEKHYVNNDTRFHGYYSDAWIGGSLYYDGLYDIAIQDVDFKNATVTCNYYIYARSSIGGIINIKGDGTFDIVDGYKFYIPFENGKIEICLSIYSGIDEYFEIELN